MKDKIELSNSYIDDIHNKLYILKKYNFKYEIFLEYYKNLETLYQKVISSDKYNTNLMVQFEDSRINDLYTLSENIDSMINKTTKYFNIFDSTEEILNNYNEDNFERYLTIILNDLNYYIEALNQGYKEDNR